MTESAASKTPTVETLSQRLDGMQEAVRLLQAFADKAPTTRDVHGEVAALKELTAADFKALRELLDSKFDGNKVALDAALKTQKEGSDKIESNFVKQIDGVLATIETLTKTTDDKIGDLKDRVTLRDGQTVGHSDSRALIFSVIAAVVGGGALVVGVIALLAKQPPA